MIAKKKNKKADLEKKRFAFFQIGLIIAGAMCLAAFEYSTLQFGDLANNKLEDNSQVYTVAIPEEYIEKQEVAVKKPVQIKVITEVTPSDKPDIKPSKTVTDSKNIKINEPAIFGEDGGSGDVIVTTVTDSVYEVPQHMPEFPGGVLAMRQWINSHLDLPHYAEPMNGTVYVRFIVDKDGSVTNVSLTKGIHSDYDKASLAVVQQMPKWSPGEQAGKKVKVRYDLPIKFVNR